MHGPVPSLPRPYLRQPLRGLLLVLSLGTLAACGDSVEQAARSSYSASLFEFISERPMPPKETVLLERAVIQNQDQDHGWSVDGAMRTSVERIWAGGNHFDTELLPGLAIVGRGTIQAERALAETSAGANRIEVDLSFWGPGKPLLDAAFVAHDGSVVARSAPAELRSGRGPSTYVFHLPRSGEGTPERLRLSLENLEGPVGLVAARIMEQDRRSILPAHDSPAAVSVGSSSRWAVGIHEGTPLQARLVVPGDGKLHVAAARPVGLAPAEKVHVKLDASGGRSARWILSIPENGWLDEMLDVGTFGGRETSVTISVDRGAAALGGGRIVSRRPTPSVVLMSSDTHRADHLGSTSRSFELRTPNLDRLATNGTQFLRCSSTTNITNPSHIALLTGVHPRDSGVVTNTTPILDRAWTLAEEFQRAGYRTMAVTSALHLQPRFSGLSQGFDFYDAPVTGGRRGDETLEALSHWLPLAADEPLFVFVHIYEAHVPYVPLGPSVERHLTSPTAVVTDGSAPKLPAWAGSFAQKASKARRALGLPEEPFPERWLPAHLYRAEVEDVDRLVGKVRRMGRLGEGIFAFSSDHGESFGDRGVWWDHASLAPDNLDVPLLITGPGVPVQSIETPVQNHRLGATLLGLARVEAPSIPGASLMQQQEERPRFALSAGGDSASVTLGPWQLTMALRTCHVTGREEQQVQGEVSLVDLRDPVPRPERLEDDFNLAKRLRGALLAWLQDANAERLADAPAELSDSARESLAALGYTHQSHVAPDAWWDPSDADPAWLERFR